MFQTKEGRRQFHSPASLERHPGIWRPETSSIISDKLTPKRIADTLRRRAPGLEQQQPPTPTPPCSMPHVMPHVDPKTTEIKEVIGTGNQVQVLKEKAKHPNSFCSFWFEIYIGGIQEQGLSLYLRLTWTSLLVQDDLELRILFPLPPKCWGYVHATQCLILIALILSWGLDRSLQAKWNCMEQSGRRVLAGWKGHFQRATTRLFKMAI